VGDGGGRWGTVEDGGGRWRKVEEGGREAEDGSTHTRNDVIMGPLAAVSELG